MRQTRVAAILYISSHSRRQITLPLPVTERGPSQSRTPYAECEVGRFILNAGILLVIVGLLVLGAERLGIRLGRLPGDIRIEGRHGGFYFPIVTCLLLSALLSAIAWLFRSR
jgi:hypothetical protein